MKVAIMIALMTTSYIPHEREMDAIVFKNIETCVDNIIPIRKELLKTVKEVQLGCVERTILK
jgi:hypothetical protein